MGSPAPLYGEFQPLTEVDGGNVSALLVLLEDKVRSTRRRAIRCTVCEALCSVRFTGAGGYR